MPDSKSSIDKRWDKFLITVERRKKRQRRAVAAICSAVAVAAVFLILPRLDSRPGRQLTAETSAFEKTVILPDGSMVILAPDSRIFFPESFSGQTREVRLLGEALFEVESSPERPFIVHLNGGSIKVTGTRFTATSYPGDDELKVSLERGCVELEVDGQEPIVMHPSQEIRIDRSSGKTQDRHLVFKDCRLEDIMESVSGIYGVNYRLSPSLKDTRLSFRILQYDDISQVMKLIGLACGVNYMIAADGTVILSEE